MQPVIDIQTNCVALADKKDTKSTLYCSKRVQ
jgi:hypothetical protein